MSIGGSSSTTVWRVTFVGKLAVGASENDGRGKQEEPVSGREVGSSC